MYGVAHLLYGVALSDSVSEEVNIGLLVNTSKQTDAFSHYIIHFGVWNYRFSLCNVMSGDELTKTYYR